MIDRAGLEIRYTPFGYRGFESLTLRNKKRNQCGSFFLVVNVNVKVRVRVNVPVPVNVTSPPLCIVH